LCANPSVIIGRKGAYRGIHFSREPFFVIDTAFYLKPKCEFNIQWAYYQLKNFDINKIDSGSAIPSTSREAFYEIPVFLPPLPAQRRIAGIMEGSILGEKVQPGVSDLNRIAKQVKQGQSWDKIFPGVASINFSAKGYGPSLDLRITKKEGIPVQLVPEGTPGATVVAIKRIDELGFYNLGRDQLAAQVGLSGPQTTAIIRYLKLQDDKECFKEFTIRKSKFKSYSQKAITVIKEALKNVCIEEIWKSHGMHWNPHGAPTK
jgi:hypothetical protein